MSASALGALSGPSNDLLLALSDPQGMQGVEFDLRDGQLVLVPETKSEFPGFFPNKDDKVKHLVAIANEVQDLVQQEVDGGNRNNLNLRAINRNLQAALGNLAGRVHKHAAPSPNVKGFLKDLFPSEDNGVVRRFGRVKLEQLSPSEQRRYVALQKVSARFIEIRAHLERMSSPMHTLRAANNVTASENQLARLMEWAQGTGGISSALEHKKTQLLQDRKQEEAAIIDAMIRANQQGLPQLQNLIMSMRADIAGAYTLDPTKTAAAGNLATTGTLENIQALYKRETNPSIKSQLENLTLALALEAQHQTPGSTGSFFGSLVGAAKGFFAYSGPSAAEIAAGTSQPQQGMMRRAWSSTAGKVAKFAAIALFETGYLPQVLSLTAEAGATAAQATPSLASYAPLLGRVAFYTWYANREFAPQATPPAAPTGGPTGSSGGLFGRLGAAAAAARQAFNGGAAAAATGAATPPPHVTPTGHPPAAAAAIAAANGGYGALPVTSAPEAAPATVADLEARLALLDRAPTHSPTTKHIVMDGDAAVSLTTT